MAIKIEEEEYKGVRFGKLIVTAKTDDRFPKSGSAVWLVDCDCGTKDMKVRIGSLRNGHTQSCGCLHKHLVETHGRSQNEKLYIIWQGIKRRCHVKASDRYKDYGGRGIKMYRAWRYNYLAFRTYVIELPNFPQEALNKSKEQLTVTIDRIDNNKGYKPGNLKWSTKKEQTRNMRNNVYVEFEGQKRLLPELCEEKGKKYNTVYGRLYRGRSIEQALA